MSSGRRPHSWRDGGRARGISVLSLGFWFVSLFFLSTAFALGQPLPAGLFSAATGGSASDSLKERPYRTDRLGRIDQTEGVRRARYRVAARVSSPTSPTASARAYLAQAHAEYGLEQGIEDLALIDLKTSPGATHVVFQQTLGGVPVFEHQIKVSLDARLQPSMAISGYSPGLRRFEAGFDTNPRIPAGRVAGLIRERVGDPEATVREPVQVVFADKAPKLAWETVVWLSTTAAEFLVLLDARTGEFLLWRDQATHVRPVRESRKHSFVAEGLAGAARAEFDRRVAVSASTLVEGSGFAFLPDPLTSAGVPYGGLYVDANDADVDVLNAERKVVALKEISRGSDGLHRLEGPYVRITNQQTPGKPRVTFMPPAEADPNAFFYTRADDRFEAVNAYYHVDTSQRYVQSLGFTNVQNAPIPLNPHGHGTEDNSQYFPALNYLSFGDGGIDDAEDADVIWHEYGHALLEGASPGLRSTVEGQSVHEAWADYWAASQRRSLFDEGLVPPGNWRRLFPWDGNNTATSPPWLGRTLDATGPFPGVLYDLYTPGVHWATSVMEIYDVVGRTISDRLHLQANYYLSSPVTYRDLAEALIRADVDLYEGRHVSLIIDVLGRRGYLDPADYGPILAHTPLSDTEKLGVAVTIEVAVESLLHPVTVVEVVVREGEGPAVVVPAVLQSQNRYTATLHLPDHPALLRYHIRAQDSSGRVTVLPSTAPLIEFTFQVGPDEEPPVIAAWPIASASLLGWPVIVDVTVTDNLGVDSVWVDYRLLRGEEDRVEREGSFGLVGSGSRYAGAFPVPVEWIEEGDRMEYRVIARDVATAANLAMWPVAAEGWHRFDIGSPSIYFDFEGAVGGIHATGDWMQGSPTFGVHFAHSGAHVWATVPDGAYTTTAGVSTLLMPAVNLSAFDEAYLVFRHWYDFEHNGAVQPEGSVGGILYDGGNVKLSTDGGVTWTLIEPENGYPGSISTMFGNPLGGQRAFGGYSYGWRPEVFTIPVGADIRIRFDVGTDDGNSETSLAYAGWVIDDVAFVAQRPEDQTPPVVVELPPAVAEYAATPHTEDPRVTIWLADDTALLSVFAEYDGFVGGRTVAGRARLAMSGTNRERFEGVLPVRGRDGFDPGDHLRYAVVATDFGGNERKVEAQPGVPFEVRYYLGEQVDLMSDGWPSGAWHRSTGTWSVGKADSPRSSLVLRRHDLPDNAEDIQLVIRHAYRLGQGAGGNLKISVDGGTTWSPVAPISGYPVRLGSSLPGLANEEGYSNGITSGTIEGRFDLSAFAGKQVQLRVDFASTEAMAENEFWRLEGITLDLRTTSADAFDTPHQPALHANFPNPFFETTSLSYTLDEEAGVRLEVFDVLGRRVALVFEGEQEPGTYSYILNGTALPAGMYLVRLQAGDRQWVRTVIRLRG
jgi:hypothetical protein